MSTAYARRAERRRKLRTVDTVTAVIPFKRDANQEWLRETLSSLPAGMRYLIAENDGEMAAALNDALRQVETEFVLVSGADDRWHQDAVEKLVDAAWNADVCYPTFVYTREEDMRPLGVGPAAPFCPNRLLVWNYVPGAALIRASAVRELGGYRDLETLEDWDLWVRMSRAGHRFKPVPQALYLYRQVKGSRNSAQGDPTTFRARWRQAIVGETAELDATFYHGATPAQIYWRCQLPARHLPGQTMEFPEFRAEERDEQVELAFQQHRGAAVWQFPADAARAVFIAEMQEQGIRCLVEVDDNYLAPAPNRHGWSWRQQAGPSNEAHRRIVEYADGVICATEALATRYRKVNPNVHVCPNSIEPADWPDPQKLDDGILRVGVAGGSAHLNDMRLIRPALEWAAKQDGVEVIVFGILKAREGTLMPVVPHDWRFEFTHVRWVDELALYREQLGLIDIGLAPLVATPWSVCKSDLKVLEYAMAGACALASDTEPYQGWRDSDGITLCQGPRDFLRQVQELVADPAQARERAAATRARVLAERTIDQTIERWHHALTTQESRLA